MTSDNIVADFIQSNLDTIPYINYREIDLTSSNLVKALSEENALSYIKGLVSRDDGLDDIVSNYGFHCKGLQFYWTGERYVYRYDFFSLGMCSMWLADCFDFSSEHRGVISMLHTIYWSPIVPYFFPLYDKTFNANNLNRNISLNIFNRAVIFILFYIFQWCLDSYLDQIWGGEYFMKSYIDKFLKNGLEVERLRG